MVDRAHDLVPPSDATAHVPAMAPVRFPTTLAVAQIPHDVVTRFFAWARQLSRLARQTVAAIERSVWWTWYTLSAFVAWTWEFIDGEDGDDGLPGWVRTPWQYLLWVAGSFFLGAFVIFPAGLVLTLFVAVMFFPWALIFAVHMLTGVVSEVREAMAAVRAEQRQQSPPPVRRRVLVLNGNDGPPLPVNN